LPVYRYYGFVCRVGDSGNLKGEDIVFHFIVRFPQAIGWGVEKESFVGKLAMEATND
jgi:hypothetical protein